MSLADVQLMKHLSGLAKNHSHFMKITPPGAKSIELDMINDLTLAPSSAQKNFPHSTVKKFYRESHIIHNPQIGKLQMVLTN